MQVAGAEAAKPKNAATISPHLASLECIDMLLKGLREPAEARSHKWSIIVREGRRQVACRPGANSYLLDILVGIWVSRSHHADLVVGEGQVIAPSRQSDLGHVTTCAIRLRYWAGLGRLGSRRRDER